jgi:integrase
MIDVNPAKHGVDNPQRRQTEKRPFDSWAPLEAVATHLGPLAGPMVIFAAATGLRPGEWIALEHRDIDLDGRVLHVRRAYRNGRIKVPRTVGSMRSVPLQDVAVAALGRIPVHPETPLVFPGANGGYFDLHNFRVREWRPAQKAAGVRPFRRVYDLRHTFATFALRAGVSAFALSRYMGASLTMSDRHYGHLTSDGGDHARRLLDLYSTAQKQPWTLVDARWTSEQLERVRAGNAKAR